MSDYRVLAMDLDGTLTNAAKQVTPVTRKCIWEAIAVGVQIVLASGRPPIGIEPDVQALELRDRGGYILSNNGSLVYNCKTGETIVDQTIPAVYNHIICEAARLFPGVSVLAYDASGMAAEPGSPKYTQLDAFNNGVDVRLVESLEAYLTGATRHKFTVVGEPDALLPVNDYLQQNLHDKLSIFFTEPFFLEIAPFGISKASSLDVLVRRLGYARENVIACGDGFNDISMLDYAGFAVAMENAYDLTKRHADFIAPSNNNDGVAQIITRFLLDTGL